MRAPLPGSLGYVIGPDDRIVAVDQAWDAFATTQGGRELTSEKIVGRPFGECVTEPHTREMCMLLFRAARNSQRPVVVPFRCDSPGLRRFMTLSITPRADGMLTLNTVLDREESRPPLALLDIQTQRTNDFIRICGWCKKIVLPSGSWVEVEEAVRELGLLAQARLPRLSHGICPTCSESLHAEIEAQAKSGRPAPESSA
jgi:hypothetical protein